MPYDPAIPFLGIYLDKTIIQKDACTPMFIAVLFTIGKTWKLLKCPSEDEWIKKTWCLHTMEYYSITKKNERLLFAATWMNTEIIKLSKILGKTEGKKRRGDKDEMAG